MTGTEVTGITPAKYEPPASVAPQTETHAPAPPAWQRFALRFLFAYFVVLLFPGPLQIIPGLFALIGWFFTAEASLTVWIGRNVLGITAPMPNQPTGSGDTMIAWVRLLPVAAASLAIAAAWLWYDRRRARTNDARVAQWFIVYLRFTLAFILFGYGFAKIFQAQFPPLGPERLVETLGEMSPMGLLWTFMGFSKPYNVFAGLGEVVGGLLLCFGRTATLGGLVAAGVMANIVALNFMYDVPVKQYSAHLMLMALIVAAPDMHRLANVLVLRRPTDPRAEPPLFVSPRVRRVATGVTAIAIVYALGLNVYTSSARERIAFASPATAPFYGVYEIEELRRNGAVVPLLVTNRDEWRRMTFSAYRTPIVYVRLMGDSAIRFAVVHDSVAKTLKMTGRAGTGDSAFFRYTVPRGNPNPILPQDRLVLSGRFRGDSLDIRLVKSSKSYLLMSRGFNWVQELPFNR